MSTASRMEECAVRTAVSQARCLSNKSSAPLGSYDASRKSERSSDGIHQPELSTSSLNETFLHGKQALFDYLGPVNADPVLLLTLGNKTYCIDHSFRFVSCFSLGSVCPRAKRSGLE